MIYLFALLLYWLASYIAPGGYARGGRLLSQVCEPILKPVRRLIPPIGQIDFSVLWVSILIGALLAVGVALVANDSGPIWARALGFVALVFASVNIFGGFLVTQRMLSMYTKKKK